MRMLLRSYLLCSNLFLRRFLFIDMKEFNFIKEYSWILYLHCFFFEIIVNEIDTILQTHGKDSSNLYIKYLKTVVSCPYLISYLQSMDIKKDIYIYIYIYICLKYTYIKCITL